MSCWDECGGGSCPACKNYQSSAIFGYCCSGVNHRNGNGPISNRDCPDEAIAAQKSIDHTCVVLTKKGKLQYTM
jgi:hypothetical protein